jgi:thiamine biosynthesis protein ThiI
MTKVLLLKLSGEIFIKSDFTKHFFEEKLKENIILTLKANKITNFNIQKGRGRFFIEAKEKELIKALKVLPFVFGLHSIALSECITFNSINELTEKAKDFAFTFIKPKDSFAVRTTRIGKHSFSSQQVNELAGKKILDSIKGLKVNLNKPKKELFIEIINNKAFFYSKEIKCFEGLPVGTQGNIALLMKGKKEEFFSAFLMLRKGCNVLIIKAKKIESKKILKENLKKLVKWNSFKELEFFNESNLIKLIKEKRIKAIVLSNLNPLNLNEIKGLIKDFKPLVVFMPLLFFTKKELNNLSKTT